MEQRVRDLIESLEQFDPDIRVSEKTTLNFKYDGVKTRLVVECNGIGGNGVDLAAENRSLMQTVKSLEDEVDDLEGDKVLLRGKIDDLESELRDARKSLEKIRGAL